VSDPEPRPDGEQLPDYIRDALAAPAPDAPPAPDGAQAPPPAMPPAGGSADPHARDLDRARAYVTTVPGAAEGGRNTALNAVAFRLLELFPLSESDHRALCLDWCGKCSPPLPEREAQSTIASAWKGASRKHEIGAAWTPPRAPGVGAAARTQTARPPPGAKNAADPLYLETAFRADVDAAAKLEGTAKDEALRSLFARLAPVLPGADPWRQQEARKLLRERFGMDVPTFRHSVNRARKRARGAGEDGDGEGHADYQQLARDFLAHRSLGEPGPDLRLRYWREDFYLWEGTRWQAFSEKEFAAGWLTPFLQEPASGVSRRVSASLVGNVLANLRGLSSLPGARTPPFWIDRAAGAAHTLSLKNGLLDLDGWLGGRPDLLQRHTPRLFNLVALPYEYKPGAECPAFHEYLARVQPDPENRAFLQEWLGYNLIPDTTLETFVLFCGRGANGKSVFLAVLKMVLGEDNVSAAPLQAFGAERTFGLVPTIGKLANVDEDLGFVTLREEGSLKKFVSGNALSIEGKGKDAYAVTPTARLTFSCNYPPKFHDPTNGIWRRLVFMPWEVEIPKGEAKPQMKSRGFWEEELSGIFLWALEGLKRLLARRHFHEPKLCADAKTAYFGEMNPAHVFLSEEYEPCEHGQTEPFRLEDCQCGVWCQDLFRAYQAYVKEEGIPSKEWLRAVGFGRQVRLVFKNARQSQVKRRKIPRQGYTEEVRDRQWLGIRKRPREDELPAPADSPPPDLLPPEGERHE
jgi:P4 family phage/plasmid primase-like protien